MLFEYWPQNRTASLAWPQLPSFGITSSTIIHLLLAHSRVYRLCRKNFLASPHTIGRLITLAIPHKCSLQTRNQFVLGKTAVALPYSLAHISASKCTLKYTEQVQEPSQSPFFLRTSQHSQESSSDPRVVSGEAKGCHYSMLFSSLIR